MNRSYLFKDDVRKTVNQLADKYDIEVEEIFSKTSEDTSFTITFKGYPKPEGGKTLEQVSFETYCRDFGFSPNDYGAEYISNGKVMKFIGFNPRARKYPYLVRDLSDGKTYKTTYVNIQRV